MTNVPPLFPVVHVAPPPPPPPPPHRVVYAPLMPGVSYDDYGYYPSKKAYKKAAKHYKKAVKHAAKAWGAMVVGVPGYYYDYDDDDFYEELEEILIMGDIGVNATNDIIERMKEEVKKKHLRHPSECKELLVESIKEQMRVGETAYDFEKEQSIIFIIGVNGVGKTTSVGKLAGILKKQGKKSLDCRGGYLSRCRRRPACRVGAPRRG